MNTLSRLIKFNLSYYFKPRFDDKKSRNKFIALLVVLAVCFIMPLIMVIGSVYMSTAIAVENHILPEMLSILFMTAQVATVFFGMASYINIMYFSKDNAILASMPIRSSHIYIARLVVCLLSMVGISSFVVLPSVIVSAIAISNAGITLGAGFYIMGILSIVYVPLVPLLIISILSFPVMKVVSYLKKKPVLMSIVQVVFMLLVMFAIWGGMYALEMGIDKDNISIENLIMTVTSLSKASFSTLVLSRIMLGVNVGANVGILIGIVIGFVLLNVGLTMLLYKNTLTKLEEGGADYTSSKKNVKDKVMSTRLALFLRELKSVMRQPDFFIQTLMMIVLSPIMIVVFSLLGGQPTNDSIGNPKLFLTGMVFFYMTMTMGLNYLSTIGISRDREKIAILKSMPVNSRDIIIAKLLLADIASFVGCLVCTIAYICTVDVPFYYAIFMLISGLIISCTTNVFSLLRDAKKPNLKWINSREIIKNNFGTMIPMLINIALGMVVVIVAGALSALPLEAYQQELITWAVIFVLSIILYFVFAFRKVDKIVHYFEIIE